MKSAEERKKFLVDKCKQQAQMHTTKKQSHITLPAGYQLLDLKDLDKKKVPYKQLVFVPYIVSVKNHPMDIPQGYPWFEKTYKLHKYIGMYQQSIVCPSNFGKRCPLCEEVQILKSDYEANKNIITNIQPQVRQLFQVFDLDTDTSYPFIFDTSYHQFGKKMEIKIAALCDRKNDDSYQLFWDLKDGKIVEVLFVEESFKKGKFWKAEEFTFDDREDLDDDILRKSIDLDDPSLFGNILSYQQIKDIYYCVNEEETEESTKEKPIPEKNNEDEIPKKKFSFGKKKNDDDITEEKEKNDEPTKESVFSKKKREIEDDTKEDKKTKKGLSLHKKNQKEEDEKEAPEQKQGDDNEEDNECPAGHQFGVDTHQKDECEDCDVWKECQKKKKELRSKK